MFTPQVCTLFLFKAYDLEIIIFAVKIFPQFDSRDNCLNIYTSGFQGIAVMFSSLDKPELLYVFNYLYLALILNVPF